MFTFLHHCCKSEFIITIRFNALYAKEAIKWQPRSPDPNTTINSLRWRGLEGFVAAISPFNFTAIGGNLAYTPAMMVNVLISFYTLCAKKY